LGFVTDLVASVGGESSSLNTETTPDNLGQFIFDELCAEGVKPHLRVASGFKTGVAHLTYFSDGARLMVCDSPVTYELQAFWLGPRGPLLSGYDIVFLSGYMLLRGRSSDMARRLLRESRQSKVLSVLDVVPHDSGKLALIPDIATLCQLADVVCIASITASDLLGLALPPDDIPTTGFTERVYDALKPNQILCVTHQFSRFVVTFDGTAERVTDLGLESHQRRGNTDEHVLLAAASCCDES
jgi:sugar/nucleoside kinase (ribokinase family)